MAFFLNPQEQRLRRFQSWRLFLIVADTSFRYLVLVTTLFLSLFLSLSPGLAFWWLFLAYLGSFHVRVCFRMFFCTLPSFRFWYFISVFVFVLLVWLYSYSFSPSWLGSRHCPLSSHTQCQFLYKRSQNGLFRTMERKPFGFRHDGTRAVWFLARWCVNFRVVAWFVPFWLDLPCLACLCLSCMLYLVSCIALLWG